MGRRLRQLLVPVLLSLLAAAAALEIGLRIFYRVIPLEMCAADPILSNYVCQPYFEYDRPVRLGYRYRPNLRLEGTWDPANPFLSDAGKETRPTGRSDPFWYVLETDEMGFPNSEPTWRDGYNVIVTGDSFTIRTAPTSWIESLTAQTGRSILTLGAPSWTTLNEVEAVTQFGLDKNPDWVILLFFEGNDLINVQQYLEKQASGLSWKEYDLVGVPLHHRSVLWHGIRYLLRPQEPPSNPESIRYRYPVKVNSEAGAFETVLKDVHLLPISADYETIRRSDEFEVVREALLALKTAVEAQQARLLVVYVPSKEHVYWSRIWDETDVNNILERTVTVRLSKGDRGRLIWEPRHLDFDTFNANHRAQEQVFVDFLSGEGFDFINLTPHLWEATIASGEPFHYADPHWNQTGNDLVAGLLADYLAGQTNGP